MRGRPIGTVLLCVMLLCINTVGFCADDSVKPPAQRVKRPVMTVTYSEIQGKVFFSGVREGVEEEPAPNVRVQIRDVESDKVLRETRTDKEGYYSLPKLEPAEYLMLIGAFKIQLVVRPETQSLTELPKILIVILPEEMVQSRDR